MTYINSVTSYLAFFDPAKEGGYNVSFPDFPGCVTFGRTFEEAQEKATEVLELWIEELRAPVQDSVGNTVLAVIFICAIVLGYG